MRPRSNYLSWDEYFMGVAVLAGQRSKDPNRQVGACIVDEQKHVLGIGYNGFPRGCHDDKLPWSGKEKLDDDETLAINDASLLKTKYPYVCHAEANAILNCHRRNLEGCTIYVALFPCNECTKLIIQCGIKHVVYLSDKNHDRPAWVASRTMLEMAKVDFSAFHPVRTSEIKLPLTGGAITLPDKIPRKDFHLPSFAGGLIVGALLAAALFLRKAPAADR
ncbi:putative deoxycytidylate deaminase [Diplonema papillatum]|nr:putative deoxycytidylate deaminase [Diplonema papillatum]